MVAVRSRPMLVEEQLRGIRKDILRVMEEKMVVVLDPDEEEGKVGTRDRCSSTRVVPRGLDRATWTRSVSRVVISCSPCHPSQFRPVFSLFM